jgi:polyhydroxybutyrate depolymerase
MRNRLSRVVLLASGVAACLFALGCGGDEEPEQRNPAVIISGSGGTFSTAGTRAAGVGAAGSLGRGSAGIGVPAGQAGSIARGPAGAAAPPPPGAAPPPPPGAAPPPPPGAAPPPPPGAAPPPPPGAAPPPPPGAGAPPVDAPPAMSAGCGKAQFPPSARNTIMVGDLNREYIVKLPTNYDPNKPYKLVFTWHFLGGSAQGIAGGFGGGFYGLESMAAGTAIFVSPEGIDAAWPNTGGRDVNFARAMVEWMRANYCIDNARIFSTGFSYGAIMSNTVGCQMGDVFRAIAPMAGSGPLAFGGGGCKGPVAAWIFHGTADNVVQFTGGQRSRDHWVMTNGCTMMTTPGTPSQCVEYQGCKAGYPVVWCENPGAGHTQPSYGGSAIWKFFSQF